MRFRDSIEGRSIALPTALRRRLEQPHLEPPMFTPTKFATAAEKAAFARHFVWLLSQDMPASQFTRLFHQRLSMTFSHIAHFNQFGFYEHFFADLRGKVRFLEQTLGHWPVGDPTWTFVDVERELQMRVHAAELLPLYQARLRGGRQTSAGPEPARRSSDRASSIPAAHPPQADLFDLA